MAATKNTEREVWITGIGIVSSLGEGPEAHWQALTAETPEPVIDRKTFTPYSIHPLCELDFSKQIPRRGDLRQMEDWQRIGTYAAGMALDDAGIKGDEDLLAKTHIIAAAGNGERDPQADATVLEAIKGDGKWRERLNDLLLTNLRPTLYLAQQTQLLAGNISIVHKVTGGSRTYKGEEIAGVQIVENAVQRIQAGQGDLFLVGASYNAARWDQLLIRELNERTETIGSMGAFLVIESRQHALERGARPYARIAEFETSTTPHMHGSEQPIVEIFHPDRQDKAKSPGDMLGHGREAQFPLGMALAAIVLSRKTETSPFEGNQSQLIVTGRGMNIGNGKALVERVEA